MLVSEMNGIRPVDAGRQDCHDLHSWGPGVRQCYIIHYIISGKGTFTCGKKMYTLTMPADSGTVGTEPTAAGGAASPSGKASAVF